MKIEQISAVMIHMWTLLPLVKASKVAMPSKRFLVPRKVSTVHFGHNER